MSAVKTVKSSVPEKGTQLYLIRHAETVMNTQAHLVGGRSNETPLTPKGVAQAERLGTLLAKKGILPDRVFVSPAVRTRDTARLCLAQMDLDVVPTIHDEIQELSQGVWEGKPRAEAYDDAAMERIAKLKKDFKVEGGESMNDVATRMDEWVQRTIPLPIESDDLQRNFAFTHGGAIKYFISHKLGWDHVRTFQTPIENTSVSLLVANGEDWDIAFYNRDAADL